MNLQSLQWTTSVTEIMWYRKLMPVKKICLGGTLSWRAFVLADCNPEVKADVKSTLFMSRSNTSYWNKLMRVQNGVLGNESISSSCQAWCLTTSEWVNNHCYFVSFEHSVSLQVLHLHSNRPRLNFLGGISMFGGKFPPKCAWIKHWSRGINSSKNCTVRGLSNNRVKLASDLAVTLTQP